MAKQLYLIKEGEISLKGLNRGLFEKRLKNNIKPRLSGRKVVSSFSLRNHARRKESKRLFPPHSASWDTPLR